MTDDFKELIERSSFGTPGAKALRARTPQHVVDEILNKVKVTRMGARHDYQFPTGFEGWEKMCDELDKLRKENAELQEQLDFYIANYTGDPD